MTKKEYYKNKLDHLEEAAEFHEDKERAGINPDYHRERAEEKYDQIAEIEDKDK